jgi:hypothetical protein
VLNYLSTRKTLPCLTLPWPPLWSSGQSSWLQIQRSRLDSRRYQIFWEAVGLERCPLRLVSTTEELLGRKSSGSGLENRRYDRGVPLSWPRDTLYPQKLALTSPTSCGRSVSIVLSRTKPTEFSFLTLPYIHNLLIYSKLDGNWAYFAVLFIAAILRSHSYLLPPLQSMPLIHNWHA